MFEYIKGTVIANDTDSVVIEAGAFAYRVYASRYTLNHCPISHEPMKLLLHPVFREDDVILYGFGDNDERDLFRTLIAVSGIGPKAAMGVLSQFSGDELIRHILTGDAKAIAKAPGIGKKTAERIVLELKDKYKGYSAVESDFALEGGGGAIESVRLTDNLFNEAVNGLMGLGFSYAEAASRTEKVMKPDMTIEAILQQALSVTM